jgi:hypothetical protein
MVIFQFVVWQFTRPGIPMNPNVTWSEWSTFGTFGHCIWYCLVVWNIVFLHNIWDNPSHWLSYFSRWLKAPTRIIWGKIGNCERDSHRFRVMFPRYHQHISGNQQNAKKRPCLTLQYHQKMNDFPMLNSRWFIKFPRKQTGSNRVAPSDCSQV